MTILALRTGNEPSDVMVDSSGGFQLSTSKGNAVSSVTRATAAGPTSPLQFNAPGTGSPLKHWVSPPLAADVTISQDITCNIWAYESNMNANATIEVGVYRLDSLGNILSTIVDPTGGGYFGTELGTSAAAKNWVATPTSTNMKKGDRILVRLYADDYSGGNMASGYTITADINATGAADGDSYLDFTDTLDFSAITPTTKFYLRDAAADADLTANTDKALTLTAGSSAVAKATSTVAGPTSGVQATDGAGGSAIDWWSKTLGGGTIEAGAIVIANLWGLEGAATANACPRVVIEKTAGDGSSPVAIASGTLPNELGTSAGVRTIYLQVASQVVIASGERIHVRVYWDDVTVFGNMASGSTATLRYGYDVANTADTWVGFPITLAEATNDKTYSLSAGNGHGSVAPTMRGAHNKSAAAGNGHGVVTPAQTTARMTGSAPSITTHRPNAGQLGGVPIDADFGLIGVDETWAAMRARASASSGSNTNASFGLTFKASTTPNQWVSLRRAMLLFDTSGLGTVISAEFSVVYSAYKQDQNGAAPSVNVYGVNPAQIDRWTTTDWAQFGSTPFCDTPIPYASWTTGRKTFALNAAGIAAINTGGITKLALAYVEDLEGAGPAAWVSNGQTEIDIRLADTADITNDPQLVITCAGEGGLAATGEGVVTITAKKNGKYSAVAGAGHGILQYTYSVAELELHSGSASASGYGDVAWTQKTARSRTYAGSGHGVAAYAANTQKRTQITGTGKGVEAYTNSTARKLDTDVTGEGTANSVAKTSRPASLTGTGAGGFAPLVATLRATTLGVSASGPTTTTQSTQRSLTTVVFTGEGTVAVTYERSQAPAEVRGTGYGDASLTITANHRPTFAASGHGVVVATFTSTRSGASSGTGAGDSLLASTTARRVNVPASGAGDVVVTPTTARSSTHATTGSGTFVATWRGAHVATTSATGAGVATIATPSDKAVSISATGEGVATTAHTGAHRQVAAGTAHGIASFTISSARAATFASSGSGVVSYAYTTSGAPEAEYSFSGTGFGIVATLYLPGHVGTFAATGAGAVAVRTPRRWHVGGALSVPTASHLNATVSLHGPRARVTKRD